MDHDPNCAKFRLLWDGRVRLKAGLPTLEFSIHGEVCSTAFRRYLLAEDAAYFKSVADYIHLNPARARLMRGAHAKLVNYPWSSLRHYPKGNAPLWQPLERVLDGFRLSQERRGLLAYVSWLEARAANEGGKSTRSRWKRCGVAGIAARRVSSKNCLECLTGRVRR